MLKSFNVKDLLPGMIVQCRDGKPFNLFPGIPLARFLSGDYAEDLTHKSGDAELDLMKVCLPSGTVLWERDEAARSVCFGCVDEESHTLCGSCGRGGHGNTVDFYRVTGSVRSKEGV